MAVMIVVIIIAFLTVVAVMYWGSKEDVHAGAHMKAEDSPATAVWLQRAERAEANRKALMEQNTAGESA